MASFSARGGGYGLDAELCRQREAKYDYEAEDKARGWIEAVTQEPVIGTFGDALRDGVLLCKLINTIKPGVVRRVNQSKMPFKQMENISNFLRSCRTLGVAEHSLFETVDLFEGKDIGLVVRCVFSLGSAVQLTCPEYTGPSLGAKLNQGNKRVFNEQQKQQARVNASFSRMTMGSALSMERSQISKPGICFGAENAGQGDTTIVGKLAKGSHGIQERLPVDQSKSITFGNDKLGSGDTSVPSKSSTGSHGIMERSAISKAGITFGAETAGKGDNTFVGKLFQGSHGIQERLPVDRSKSITFGNDTLGTGKTTCPSKFTQGSHSIQERLHLDMSKSIISGSKTQQGGTEMSLVTTEPSAVPGMKKSAVDYPASAAMSPLFGADAVENNNKSWFQARSG